MSALLLAAALLAGHHAAPRLPPQVKQETIRASLLPIPPSDNELEIGRGIAVVFSPDLAAADNGTLYTALGFSYIESADWKEVVCRLEEIQQSGHPVTLLLIESHGTNGNGLKLQESGELAARRSYISLGGLQERVAPLNIELVLLSACNAGRLYRPQIYNRLDRFSPDPLFLPPTLGVFDASPQFDPAPSRVRLLRRSESELETMMEGSVDDFPSLLQPSMKQLLARSGLFTISTMLIQTLLRDDTLLLTSSGYVVDKSHGDLTVEQSETLFQRFITLLTSRLLASPPAS